MVTKSNQIYHDDIVKSLPQSISPVSQINDSSKKFPAENTVPIPNEENTSKQIISIKIFLMIFSFLHGLNAIRNMPEFIYQKDILGLSPTTIQMISGIIFLPWCVKPIFGFFYDKLMFKLQKIKYVIIVTSLLRMTGNIILSMTTVNVYALTLLFILNTLCTLAENICCECTLVKLSKKENDSNLENESKVKSNHLPIFFGYKAVGALFGNIIGGRLIQAFSVKYAFFCTAMISFFPICLCLIFNEQTEKSDEKPRSFEEELKVIKELLIRENVLEMAAFIFILNLTPNFDQITSFYLMNVLLFSEVDLSDLQSFSIVFYILGLLWYSYSLYKVNPVRFFMVTNFFYWLINCSFLLLVFGFTDRLGINSKIFCYFNYGFASLIGELNFMPIIAIWCAVCPKNLEATSITLFTGLMNTSYNISIYFGAGVSYSLGITQHNFDGFGILLIVQNWYIIVVVLGIVFIGFPDPSQSREQSLKEVKNTGLGIELVD